MKTPEVGLSSFFILAIVVRMAPWIEVRHSYSEKSGSTVHIWTQVMERSNNQELNFPIGNGPEARLWQYPKEYESKYRFPEQTDIGKILSVL